MRAHPPLKLVANRPTCFYGNSKDGSQMGLTQRNPLLLWQWYPQLIIAEDRRVVYVITASHPQSQFVLNSDFCSHTFTQLDLSFALTWSNPSHFLFTSVFLYFPFTRSIHSSLLPSILDNAIPIWVQFLIGQFVWRESRLSRDLRRKESKKWEVLETSGWFNCECWHGVCVWACACIHVWESDLKQPIEIAVCHEAPAWCSVRFSDTVTSYTPQHRSPCCCGPAKSIRHHRDVDINTIVSYLLLESWGSCSFTLQHSIDLDGSLINASF